LPSIFAIKIKSVGEMGGCTKDNGRRGNGTKDNGGRRGNSPKDNGSLLLILHQALFIYSYSILKFDWYSII